MKVDHNVVRTCVGCRRRGSATELLRVTAAPGSESTWLLAVDPRRRAPGRGAWVHPESGCVSVAERRRAFARALRVPGPLDPSALVAYVEQLDPPEVTRPPAASHESEKKLQ